jgi:capsid assembly protease
MSLFDIVTAPWAILPAHLDQIRAVFERHIRGEKVDLKKVEADLGRPLGSKPQGYSVISGVGIVPMNGVLAKKASALEQTSGMNSMGAIARDFQGALADTSVKAIILHIDSPGGTVDGTMDLARMVREARGTKPIVAFADGMMASAAYWIGSAADRIVSSGDTTLVGSIGVVATHVDVSGAEQQAGTKTTEVTAGAFKRITSSYQPLSEAGLAVIQEQVNKIYGLFVGDVAQQRGVSPEQVLQDMADGRVFMGQDAVTAGLVDGVSTLDALIADLAAQTGGPRGNSALPGLKGAGVALNPQPIKGESIMDLETLKAEHPELVQALQSDSAASERLRIAAIKDAAFPGHEDLVSALIADGKTTGPEAALAFNRAEKAKRGDALAVIRSGSPAPLPAAQPPPAVAPKAEEDLDAPLEDRCKAKWAADAQVRKDFCTVADYIAFAEADAKGLIRIHSKA